MALGLHFPVESAALQISKSQFPVNRAAPGVEQAGFSACCFA